MIYRGLTSALVAAIAAAAAPGLSQACDQIRIVGSSTVFSFVTALAKDVPMDGEMVPNTCKKRNNIDGSLPDLKIEVPGPPPTSGTRDAFAELAREGAAQRPSRPSRPCASPTGRIGDHAINITEFLPFDVTGQPIGGCRPTGQVAKLKPVSPPQNQRIIIG